MSERYILDDSGNPVLEPDLLKWARWFGTAGRHVAATTINDIRVSTVFLGVDHSFGGEGPILFETMIFGGKHDQYQERYATREEALEGHARAVALVGDAPMTNPNAIAAGPVAAGQFVEVTATKQPVVIWSGEHQSWWRENRCGYTRAPEAVGLYTMAEAIAATHHCGPEKRIRIEDVPPPTPENAEITHLREVNADLLAACEAHLARWVGWSDGDLRAESWAPRDERTDFGTDCANVLAMRAAVQRAKGGRP